MTVKRDLSDYTEGSITCSVAGNSIAKNTQATWGISGLDAGNNFSVTWSGTNVNSVTGISTYSTAGTISDVVATIADESGSIQVPCNALTVKTDITIDNGNGGGSSGSSSNSCSLLGNINGDTKCSVDIFDFNLLMLNWGSTSVGNASDLNKDGIVDILDFNILMLNWTGTL